MKKILVQIVFACLIYTGVAFAVRLAGAPSWAWLGFGLMAGLFVVTY